MTRTKTTLVILIVILLAGCSGYSANTASPQTSITRTIIVSQQPQTSIPVIMQTLEATVTPAPTETPAPVEISIMAVGDIMYHSAQIEGAYDKQTKKYDYNYSFQYIKDIIGSADLALGNFESTMGGLPYSKTGVKSFSTPDAAADALKNAGFDILSTANNHCNDRGRDGLIRTMQVMRDRGLQYIGTRENTNAKPYYIADVKGIRIGFTAYTFNSRNGDLVNTFSTSNTAKEIAKMSVLVQNMRTDGAEARRRFHPLGRRIPTRTQFPTEGDCPGPGRCRRRRHIRQPPAHHATNRYHRFR